MRCSAFGATRERAFCEVREKSMAGDGQGGAKADSQAALSAEDT